MGCGVVAGGVDSGQGTLLELHEGQPASPQPHIETEKKKHRGVMGEIKVHSKTARENHGQQLKLDCEGWNQGSK